MLGKEEEYMSVKEQMRELYKKENKMKRQVMWAWWDNKTKSFHYIYGRENMVKMCSPDGFRNKESKKEGKVVRVVVKEYPTVKGEKK